MRNLRGINFTSDFYFILFSHRLMPEALKSKRYFGNIKAKISLHWGMLGFLERDV